ncbi:MAG TPA: hypothetical protein VHN36_11100 [Ilumatobacteraceae bacterium]|nr:hypothetical protein [Ilumatobacteraceae bacterium]
MRSDVVAAFSKRRAVSPSDLDENDNVYAGDVDASADTVHFLG